MKEDIASYANFVSPGQTVSVIESDPDDNRIIESAVAAKSDFMVSGDRRHVLPLGSYKGIRIVTIGAFFELLKL